MTIPNLVTILGFLFVFLYIRNFLFGGELWLGFLFVFLAGFTDALDGFLARQLKQESFLGSILDPLRDRVILGAILWNLCLINPKIWPIIEVIIVAEILIFTTWFFSIESIGSQIWNLMHIAGKCRQAGHLILGGLAVLGVFEIVSSVGGMMVASVLLFFVRISIIISSAIFQKEGV